jgi:hypothetical protein
LRVPETIRSDTMTLQYGVFAVLDTDESVRVTDWTENWHDAIDRHTVLDNTRLASIHRGWTNVRYFAVRAKNDPQWTASPYRPDAIRAGFGKGTKEDRALRKIGNVRGLEGREGGWIYRNGVPVEQGWRTFRTGWTRSGWLLSTGVGLDGRYWMNEYRRALYTTPLGHARDHEADLATAR